MIGSLRRSFAAKLIVGGCVMAILVVGGVAGYLIASRTAQTRGAAQSNADNRVEVMAQVLDRFTAVEAVTAAQGLASQPALQRALAAPDPATEVGYLLTSGGSLELSGDVLLVTDAAGAPVFVHGSPGTSAPSATGTPAAVRAAIGGGTCTTGGGVTVRGGCGFEPFGGDLAYVVALPVRNGTDVVGAVAYLAPLAFQLQRFQALFSFPTAYIPAQAPGEEFHPGTGAPTATDSALRAGVQGGGGLVRGVYSGPLSGGGTGTVAGSFVPVRGSDGSVTGYIGVEVPLAQFAGDERSDILVVSLIAVFLLLVVAITVVLFVDRFVKGPVARLEHGVARIAGGDYASDIPVRSEDEIGRLAGNVNRMREAIAGYVSEIRTAHQRLDSALERVSGVSRALTTTTAGVPALQQAVVRTASALGGEPASAMLALRDGDGLRIVAADGAPCDLGAWPGLAAVLTGETVRLDRPDSGSLVAVPMFYQDAVIGALAVLTPLGADTATEEVDVGVLAVLANNAAIAMENARLFEQERQTVQRLRELDAMKTDFLSTVQHELRTPLTAILGLADLLEMCWEMWQEEPKLDAVRDIQVAARNLYDIVETLIDFSAVDETQLSLNPRAVPLRATIDAAVEAVGERYRDGLPVPVDVESEEDLSVHADPERLTQVLRAVIDNAVKFSDGNGRVRVRFATANRGRGVRIEVTDEGIGIPAPELPRVFDRFYQVDNSATRKYGGTGMGLALVKRVANAHGATVEVTSTAGAGTSVVVVWPTIAAQAADASTGGARQPKRRAAPRPPVPVQ